MDDTPPWDDTPSRVIVVLAWLLLAAALFAAFVGLVGSWLGCEQGCEGSLGNIRTAVVILSLLVLVPAGRVVFFAHRREWKRMGRALLAGIVIFALWAIALELFTHPSDYGL